MKICFMGKGDFCLCKNRTQTFLLQRKTCPRILLPAVLVIAMELARSSCHCDGTCPRILSLRWNLPAVLVIAMELARSSCHCDGTCRSVLVIAKLLARTSCHCDGVKRQKQSFCKQHLFLDYFAMLVMTKAKIATLRSR